MCTTIFIYQYMDSIPLEAPPSPTPNCLDSKLQMNWLTLHQKQIYMYLRWDSIVQYDRAINSAVGCDMLFKTQESL